MKKETNHLATWSFAALAAATAPTAFAQDFVAAEDGVAKAEIVLPAKALAVERFAAEELKYHLEKASGGTFEIKTEDEPASKRFRFYVGATKAAAEAGLPGKALEMDERLLKTDGESFFLLGGDRDGTALLNFWSATCHGSMYAVYDLLETELGVKWIWPGEMGEVVPRRPTIRFSAIERRGKEPLVQRSFQCERHGWNMIGWKKPENREKYDADFVRFSLRHRCGTTTYMSSGHAFTEWWAKYGKTHPEYFALLPNGRREPLKGDDGHYITMCVSQPAFHRAIVDNWWNSPSRHPGNLPYTPYINCCENDTPGMCTCPSCRAWDAPDPGFAASDYWGRGKDPLTRLGRFQRLSRTQWGEEGGREVSIDPPSLADRYVKFYNAVLAEARKRDPAAKVFAYAYANYTAPPRETRLSDGITIDYVPRMFFPYVKSESDRYRKQWLGWRRMGATDMVYRPNYMLAGANFPLNQSRMIVSDFNFAATNGMFACFFDSCTGAWAAHALMNYAVMRMMREPTIAHASIESEFVSAFGAAADAVRRYCDHLESLGAGLDVRAYQSICSANRTKRGTFGGGNQCFMLVTADLYTDAFFEKARAILDEAAAAATEPEHRHRVDFLRKGLEDARLTRLVRIAQKSLDAAPGDASRKAAFLDAFERMNAYRASVEADGICDYSYHAKNEFASAGWPHKWRKIPFVAAKGGVAMADIVIPAKPNQAERFAAEELKYHLEKATGGKFVIASEEGFNAKLRRCHFYIGRTEAAKATRLRMDFKPDEYAADLREERIYLRGGDRDGLAVGNGWSASWQGTLYAVYEFLEKKMGVKWLWPGETGEVVPKSPNLTFDKVSLSGNTPLVMRTWRLGPPGKSTLGWAGGAAQRDAFYESQKKFLVRHRQGSSMCFNYGHNFPGWWKRFGKTHPEYFAMLCNGKRETMKGDEGGQFSMLCESEPGVWRQIVADWLHSPERKPGNIPYKPYLNLCQNDSPGMCTCERCRAWDAPDPRFDTTPYWQGSDPLTRLGRFYRLARVGWGEEGVSKVRLNPPSLSDRYAKFYNAVLAEAKKVVPDARAVGYAYANYVDAPRNTKVDPALCLMFVPSGGYPYPAESRNRFRREWLGWKDAGVKDFLLRPNYMLSGDNFPVNFGRSVAEDFAFAYTNGMFGCYFDSLIGSWGASAPMYYVLARAIREPLVGYDRPMEEFCSSFGAAAAQVRDYVEFVERHTRSQNAGRFSALCRENKTVQGSQGGGSGSFCLVSADVFDEKWFVDADAILDGAARAAAGDADAERRIAFLRKGIRDAMLTRRVRVAQKSGDKAAFAAAFAEMAAYRASVERDGVANYGYLATGERYSAGWPHK